MSILFDYFKPKQSLSSHRNGCVQSNPICHTRHHWHDTSKWNFSLQNFFFFADCVQWVFLFKTTPMIMYMNRSNILTVNVHSTICVYFIWSTAKFCCVKWRMTLIGPLYLTHSWVRGSFEQWTNNLKKTFNLTKKIVVRLRVTLVVLVLLCSGFVFVPYGVLNQHTSGAWVNTRPVGLACNCLCLCVRRFVHDLSGFIF